MREYDISKKGRDTSLIVIACSKNKRSDEEIEILLKEYNNFLVFEDRNIYLDPKSIKLIKIFQRCSKVNHRPALRFSKKYPAYLRYKGRFYKAIWRRGCFKIWRKVVEDGWKVLILSAFYGFLRITDPIGYYDLRLSDLNNERIYFLTSREYVEPFREQLPNLYRVVLLDKSGNEIIGRGYKDYFSEAGELFAYLIHGGNPPTICKDTLS